MSATEDEALGPLAWVVVAGGWAVMVVAVLGAFGDEALRGSASWARWLVGVAVVHDVLVLPIVLGLGWLLSRWVPVAFRVPVRTALVVGAVVSLAVWPIARRWGARADNPSILPLPVAENLRIMWLVLAIGAFGVGVLT
ncbi:MAG: hypothetical protein ACK4V6_09985, partial [Microthrixaceae bacterium]